jgi:hypothetical protein
LDQAAIRSVLAERLADLDADLAELTAVPRDPVAAVSFGKRIGDGTTEVSTMSWWDSMDSIRGFAGEEPERARYYPEDDRFLLDRPDHVEHYRVEAGRVSVDVGDA